MKLKTVALCFFSICLAFMGTLAYAQSVVTGKVTDSKNGGALAGVSVRVKGTSQGTTTGNDGSYKISVPASASILQFSYTGYASQEHKVKPVVDVSLEQTAAQLSDVVVIGYGTAKRSELSGSALTVSERNFDKGTFSAPDRLIQGKVAGVQMTTDNGQPGAASTIKIRGNSAMTGTGNPLYVVDGVMLDGRSARPGLDLDAAGLGSRTTADNPLNFLDPNDIASMNVLKDAAATAIYGSRAAFGVVLITTKRGQSGQPKLDGGYSFGISNIMKQIKVLDAAQFRSALTYYGTPLTNDKGSSVNALNAILRTANTNNFRMSISSGNENARYRLSASVLDQQGIVKNSDFKKYAVGLTTAFKFLESKNLGLDINVQTSQYVQNLPPITDNAGAAGNMIAQALQWNPTQALVAKKTNGEDSIVRTTGSSIVNPVGMLQAYHDKSRVTTILASVSPYYKITPWLEYRLLYSINYSTGSRRSYINQGININDNVDKYGYAAIGNNELSAQQITNTLNINKNLTKNLSLNGVLGYEFNKYTNKGNSISVFGPSGGFGNYGLDYTNYIQYATTDGRNINSFIDPSNELQSFFARAILSYEDKYNLTLSMRADGSSKFGANNRYGYFPSVAASWNITKEKFFKVKEISNLRLRASWGITGNQEFPAGSAQGRYAFAANGTSGSISLVNNPNPDLKWQSDKQTDIGLDFGLLKNRVTGTVDYFYKTTSDLLYPTYPIQPSPAGTAVTWKNLPGQIINKGLELALNGAIVKNDKWTWDLGVNFTFLKNTVQGMTENIATGELNGQGSTDAYVQTIRNGLPMNAFYTRHFEGFDASGFAIYTDGGYVNYYAGNPNPSTLVGISSSLTYQKFTLTVNMHGAYGQKIYSNTLFNVVNVGNINGGRNIAVSVYNNPVKEAIGNPVTASDRFIESGNFMKMANLTLNYNIGPLGKVFKSANVYVTAQNLFVITKFTGFDPEVNTNKNMRGVPSLGIEYIPYPSARTFTFGVNFSL